MSVSHLVASQQVAPRHNAPPTTAAAFFHARSLAAVACVLQWALLVFGLAVVGVSAWGIAKSIVASNDVVSNFWTIIEDVQTLVRQADSVHAPPATHCAAPSIHSRPAAAWPLPPSERADAALPSAAVMQVLELQASLSQLSSSLTAVAITLVDVQGTLQTIVGWVTSVPILGPILGTHE